MGAILSSVHIICVQCRYNNKIYQKGWLNNQINLLDLKLRLHPPTSRHTWWRETQPEQTNQHSFLVTWNTIASTRNNVPFHNIVTHHGLLTYASHFYYFISENRRRYTRKIYVISPVKLFEVHKHAAMNDWKLTKDRGGTSNGLFTFEAPSFGLNLLWVPVQMYMYVRRLLSIRIIIALRSDVTLKALDSIGKTKKLECSQIYT